HGGDDRLVAVQFTDPEFVDDPDEDATRKNAADARGIDVHALVQVRLLRQETEPDGRLALARGALAFDDALDARAARLGRTGHVRGNAAVFVGQQQHLAGVVGHNRGLADQAL